MEAMKTPRHDGRRNHGRSRPLRASFLLSRNDSTTPAFSRTANCCQKRTLMKKRPNIQTCSTSKASARETTNNDDAPMSTIVAIPNANTVSKKKTPYTKTHSTATRDQNLRKTAAV